MLRGMLLGLVLLCGCTGGSDGSYRGLDGWTSTATHAAAVNYRPPNGSWTQYQQQSRDFTRSVNAYNEGAGNRR